MRTCSLPGCFESIEDRSRRTLYHSERCKRAAADLRALGASEGYDPERFWEGYRALKRRGCATCERDISDRNARTVYCSERCKRIAAARLRPTNPGVAVYEDILRFDPCSYCGRRDTYRGVGPDHIEPVAAGGDHDWSNLTACCGPCNARKKTTPLLSYLLRVPPLRGAPRLPRRATATRPRYAGPLA